MSSMSLPALKASTAARPTSCRVEAGQARHVERIGRHDPVKFHLILEQIGHHARRRGRHPVRIRFESGHAYVRHHDRVHARIDRLLEGRQLDRLQVCHVAVDARHAQVRIGGRIAVAGKVFRRRKHAAFMRALDVGRHHLPHRLRIFAERTRVYDRVDGIGIHVGHREEIPVDADGARFLCRDSAEILSVVEFAGSAESHRVRKNRRAIEPYG